MLRVSAAGGDTPRWEGTPPARAAGRRSRPPAPRSRGSILRPTAPTAAAALRASQPRGLPPREPCQRPLAPGTAPTSGPSFPGSCLSSPQRPPQHPAHRRVSSGPPPWSPLPNLSISLSSRDAPSLHFKAALLSRFPPPGRPSAGPARHLLGSIPARLRPAHLGPPLAPRPAHKGRARGLRRLAQNPLVCGARAARLSVRRRVRIPEDRKARAGAEGIPFGNLGETVGTSGVCGKKGKRVRNLRGNPRAPFFGNAWRWSPAPGRMMPLGVRPPRGRE